MWGKTNCVQDGRLIKSRVFALFLVFVVLFVALFFSFFLLLFSLLFLLSQAASASLSRPSQFPN